MKRIFLIVLLLPMVASSQSQNNKKVTSNAARYIRTVDNLSLEGATEIAARVTKAAKALDKEVTLAILDASGTTILISRGNNVGPHNTEAARRKAYTSLSTKTATFELMKNAQLNPTSSNLNTLPELLLLSGGAPIYYEGNIVGSIGVAGGGSAENDDILAKAAQIEELAITTKK